MIRYDYASPVGTLALVSDGAALTGVYFEGHRPGGPPADAVPGADRVTAQACRELERYFASRTRDFAVPLALAGTPFQQQVWRALAAIPYAETRTYGQIAKAVGAGRGVRAVGAAIGRNPVSIIVPCHRVVGANGGLTGYAGGLARKQFLLEHEQAALAKRTR